MNRPGQRTTPACWCDGRKHKFQPGRDHCGGYPKPAAAVATPLEPKGWKARTSALLRRLADALACWDEKGLGR